MSTPATSHRPSAPSTDSPESPSQEIRLGEAWRWGLRYWMAADWSPAAIDAEWDGRQAFVTDLERALVRREQLRRAPLRKPGSVTEESFQAARQDASDKLTEAIRMGLERRLGLYLGEPDAVRIGNLLVQLGGEPPREIGVCRGCALIWRRPDRKNLARYCTDCTKRQEPPGASREGDRFYFRPISAVRAMGLGSWGTQPCDVCGKSVEVKKLRDVAYCDGACKQRAQRRRDQGLPIRDARVSLWYALTPQGAFPKGFRLEPCESCESDFPAFDGGPSECPRCRDLAAGHAIYAPYGEQEGWAGIRES